MEKYNNGKIYTIRCKSDVSLIYVGSTIEPLYKRWSKHKSRLTDENYKHHKLYKTMLELGKEYFYIELFENYPCKNKEELNKREGEIIRQIATLNTLVAGRTTKEYKEECKEKIKGHFKQYYENHKEKILATKKEYRENNREKISEKKKEKVKCDCGCELNKDGLARHNKTKKHLSFIEQNNNLTQ